MLRCMLAAAFGYLTFIFPVVWRKVRLFVHSLLAKWISLASCPKHMWLLYTQAGQPHYAESYPFNCLLHNHLTGSYAVFGAQTDQVNPGAVP